MKKIYLMLISLLCLVFSTQAAVVTDLSQLSNDKVYTLRSKRAFLLYSANCPTKIAASTGKSVGNINRNPHDVNQQFKIEKDATTGKYYLYSVGKGQYVIANGMFSTYKALQLEIKKTSDATYRWHLCLGVQGMNTQEAGTTWAEGILVNEFNTIDEGNSYIIEEVVEGEDADDTTSKEIYDFAGFGDEALMDLFYKALQQGRNYPTMEEFAAAGIQASDIAFVRSHVRRAQLMDRADRLRTETYQNRNLFMNTAMDYGKHASVGYPVDKFASEAFSMWQYTNLWGSWNHSIFTAPGAWTDAAHRNGTDLMSGIKFFDTTGGRGEGSGDYMDLISRKDANGEFKYVKPLINILMFFGFDGINYNWEATGYDNADIVKFHKQLYKYAAECGFDNYHSVIYCSISSFTSSTNSNIDALYGRKETGKTHDLMLNYQANDIASDLKTTYNAVKEAYGSADGLYAGVYFAGMDKNWTNLEDNYTGICLWGDHDINRFNQFNTGDGVYDKQGNYQRLLERGFSGGNRNPANLPALSNTGNNWVFEDGKLPLQTFAGFARWIPERSTIQGNLPFGTHFTLGNGDRYYYKGKKSHNSEWYNMSAQDIVPTYRWLRYKSNTTTVSTDIDVNYTYLDAYTGGSCIELTGAATSAGTDIILYRTSLKAGNGAYAKLAVKTLKDVNASDLYLILKKKGSNTWLEYPYGNLSGKSWEEKKITLNDIANGDVIERIGLRVKGSNNNYQLYVGKLEINDESIATPANVKDVVAEVKAETKTSMSLKLHWNVDATAKARAAWGLVFNDEANIDHFEILYKNGEAGKVALVGTTSQWATLISNIEFASVNDEPYIGVRSVSTDLKTYSPVVWVEVTRGVQANLPEKTVEDTYGVSEVDPNCNGVDNARTQRYLEYVKTTGATKNLNYTANAPVADGTQYADARDQVLIVNQGQEITMSFKGANLGDGLQWCNGGGWIDLNGSGDFDHPLPTERTQYEIDKGKTEVDPEGERIFFLGKHEASTSEFVTGYTFTFKVPEDATPGDSRLRIAFHDAWFGEVQPVGYTNKGFTIDFGVKITGNNPGRAAVDTRDTGAADEPENLNAETSVENIAGEISAAEGVEGAIEFANVDKAWIYTVDGKFVNFVNNPTAVAAEAGVYLVKMQLGNVIRSAKVLVK